MPLYTETIELDPLTADPVSPPDGCMWYRGDLNQYRKRQNGVTKIMEDTDHAGDGTLHRLINDGGTSTTETWSSSKTNSEIAAAGGGKNDLNMLIEEIAYNAASFTAARTFIFRGTSALGTPVAIKAVARNGATSSDLKIRDVTNSQDICAVNFTDSTKAIIDLGSLSFLPAGEAIWELQAMKSGGGSMDIHSLHVQF